MPDYTTEDYLKDIRSAREKRDEVDVDFASLPEGIDQKAIRAELGSGLSKEEADAINNAPNGATVDFNLTTYTPPKTLSQKIASSTPARMLDAGLSALAGTAQKISAAASNIQKPEYADIINSLPGDALPQTRIASEASNKYMVDIFKKEENLIGRPIRLAIGDAARVATSMLPGNIGKTGIFGSDTPKDSPWFTDRMDETVALALQSAAETMLPTTPTEAAEMYMGGKLVSSGAKAGIMALAQKKPFHALRLLTPIEEWGTMDKKFLDMKALLKGETPTGKPEWKIAPQPVEPKGAFPADTQDMRIYTTLQDIAREIVSRKMGFGSQFKIKPAPAEPKPPTYGGEIRQPGRPELPRALTPEYRQEYPSTPMPDNALSSSASRPLLPQGQPIVSGEGFSMKPAPTIAGENFIMRADGAPFVRGARGLVSPPEYPLGAIAKTPAEQFIERRQQLLEDPYLRRIIPQRYQNAKTLDQLNRVIQQEDAEKTIDENMKARISAEQSRYLSNPEGVVADDYFNRFRNELEGIAQNNALLEMPSSSPAIDFIRQSGGINPSGYEGEMARFAQTESGIPGIISRASTKTPDGMTESLREAGILSKDATINDLVQAIEKESGKYQLVKDRPQKQRFSTQAQPFEMSLGEFQKALASPEYADFPNISPEKFHSEMISRALDYGLEVPAKAIESHPELYDKWEAVGMRGTATLPENIISEDFALFQPRTKSGEISESNPSSVPILHSAEISRALGAGEMEPQHAAALSDLFKGHPEMQDKVMLSITNSVRTAMGRNIAGAMHPLQKSTLHAAGVRAALRFYFDKSADTYTHEWWHGFSNTSLSNDEWKVLEANYRNIHGMESGAPINTREMEEYYAEKFTAWWFLRKFHEKYGGIRRMFMRGDMVLRGILKQTIKSMRGLRVEMKDGKFSPEVEEIFQRAAWREPEVGSHGKIISRPIKPGEINQIRDTPDGEAFRKQMEERFQGREAELPKYAGSINLHRIDAGEDIKKMIAETAEKYKPYITEARRGKIAHDETRRLAEDLGMKPDDLLKRRQGRAFNAEEVTAARDILNASATELKAASDAYRASGIPEDLFRFELAMTRHAAIQAQVSAVASEAGRALNAHKIMSQSARNYREMFRAIGDRELQDEIARRFASIDTNNIAEVNRFVREFAKVTVKDMVLEAWMNFMLSGPKTHIVNAVSNALTAMALPIETLTAAGIEQGRALAMHQKPRISTGETVRQVAGMLAGVVDGFRAGLRAWAEELPENELMKIEQVKYQAIPGKLGKTIRIPGRALSASDQFFKSVNYGAAMYSAAFRRAKMEGYSGNALTEKAAAYTQYPTWPMVQEAKKQAEYRTFTDPFSPWASHLNALRGNLPVRILIPFLKTPLNIAKFSLQRTPLGFIDVANKIRKGEIRDEQISTEMAAPVLGTVMFMTVYFLYKSGLITGGGPKEKGRRETLRNTGWQPYSVKIDGKYYSYNRLDPLGSIVGMAADFDEMANDPKRGQDAEALLKSASLSLAKNITSKTYMQSLSKALDAVSDPDRYGDSFVRSTVTSAVPSAVNTVAKTLDPISRDQNSIGDALRARIPGLSKTLTAKRDAWGRPISSQEGALARAFNPFNVSEEKGTAVDKEVARLGMSLSHPGETLSSEGVRVKLSPEEYEAFAQKAGKLAYGHVSELIQSQSYKNASDDDKRDMIKELIDEAKREARDEYKESHGLY